MNTLHDNVKHQQTRKLQICSILKELFSGSLTILAVGILAYLLLFTLMLLI